MRSLPAPSSSCHTRKYLALACEVAASTIVWLSRQALETSSGPLPRTEEPVTKGAGSLPAPLHLVEGVKKLAVRWRQCLPGVSCAESAMGTAETCKSQQKGRRLGRPYGDILVGLPGSAALCTQGEPLPSCLWDVAQRLLITFHRDRMERQASTVLHSHQLMATHLAPFFPD